MKPRPTRTARDLERAAAEVCSEWLRAAKLTVIAERYQGARTVEESAVITAIIVHYRCLVNFASGGYLGKWFDTDICPSDFVGREWFVSDDVLDRTMRGRLTVLNTEQQHISWGRLQGTVTVWPVGFLVREVGVALTEFSDMLANLGSPGAAEFQRTAVAVGALLAPRAFDAISVVDLAPPR